ncbi:hypothetical protein SLEP1_g39510 [Rubroshorea leprosula]|uniref:Uncharacterized protein n=1 Tax=Rubroshorea leprosula TaxID=152421 RepID=A0AAV5L0G6_9ROSI|nr:hypothetical protein SLEP1_g39510 [Rubroshorea leprosula]
MPKTEEQKFMQRFVAMGCQKKHLFSMGLISNDLNSGKKEGSGKNTSLASTF